MRLSSLLAPLAAFALAAAFSVLGARAAVSTLEDRSVEAVQSALAAEGQDWAEVLGDGLQIILEGEAPTEAVRFRAITVAGTQVDASRVIDNMSVAESAVIAPPEFTVEILRNAGGVSLIGLIPERSDRDAVAGRIAALGDGIEVADLLETADHPVPEGWTASLGFALEALELLERSKVSVSPGRVAIVAMADDSDARRRLEAELARRRPDGVRLSLDLTSPRPVITPFIARFVKDAGGARFEACSADTTETVDRIAAAAGAAGFIGKLDCPVGLGVPAGTWGTAVADAIAAVDALGAGTVTLTDADVRLVAVEGTDPDLFDEVAGRLENTLPEFFALEAVLPQPAAAAQAEPPAFSARLGPEGRVELRGPVGDELTNTTAENYAGARFGESNVDMATRVTGGMPAGWSIRVLAGIEALSRLANGAVEVAPGTVSVRGVTGNAAAREEIAQLLVERLGQGAAFEISVTYDEALDPTAALPSPAECLEQIDVAMAASKITFDPGSTDIAGSSRGVVDEIAEILRRCPDIGIEVAGYTDSQGREEMNQALSQDRAEAVLAALRQRRVRVSTIVPRGYGEADPIADNDTEAGREANRRIEFRLIEDEPAPAGEDAEDGAPADAADEADGAGDDEQD